MSTDDGPTGRFAGDERGVTVTDGIAAGAMIALCLLLVAGLGMAVLIGDTSSSGPPEANFSFSYFERNSQLIVTHERGDSVPAGEVRLTNGERSVTWAEVASINESAEVAPGNTIQLSQQSAFGADVENDDTVQVLWTGGNQTAVLARWNGG